MTQPTPDREREALLDWLGGQRSHVLGVLTGLPEENLRRPVLPSGWSCLAMVRHLAGPAGYADPARLSGPRPTQSVSFWPTGSSGLIGRRRGIGRWRAEAT